jgi:NADPH-dependent ferric siderophore reductase
MPQSRDASLQVKGSQEVNESVGPDLLVDLPDMATDRMLELVGAAGGPLADASLWPLEVVDVGPLTPTVRRMVVSAPGLGELRPLPGQDLMLRVPRAEEKVINRRYSIRSFDAASGSAVMDVSLHGAGPGTDWVRAARTGDRIDAIGPRGKITVSTEAEWHLFISDETGMPAALSMLEALTPASSATALFEIDRPADEQEPDRYEGRSLDLRWLHRSGGTVPGDAVLFLEALAELALPAGNGHAYVAAESKVVRSVQRALAERGFRQDQISAKAYWRRGLPNAEHGEPSRED